MKRRSSSPDDKVILEKVDGNGDVLIPSKGAMRRDIAEELYMSNNAVLRPEEEEQGVGWQISRASRGTRLVKVPRKPSKARGRKR
jgi:hypothetical protein